jgi:hypothetical protein
MRPVFSTWSFFQKGPLTFLRAGEFEYQIDKVNFIRTGAWRFYYTKSNDTKNLSPSYILTILTSNVRYEVFPDFVIRSPGIINSFLKERGIDIIHIGS